MIAILFAILYFVVGSFAAIFIIKTYELNDEPALIVIGMALIWPVLLVLFGSLWILVTLIDLIRRMM
jgi:hypothetical protein